MNIACYRYRWWLLGMVLWLLANSEQYAAGMTQRGAEVFAARLARHGMTTLDLINYHQSSASIIVKILEATDARAITLSIASNLHERTLPYHLRGEGIMSKASLAKLQTAMKEMIDNSMLEDYRKQYHRELIDQLSLHVKIERIALEMQKMIAAGKLDGDDFYAAYVEPVLAVRKEGIDAALVYLRPPPVVESNDSKIEEWLRKHQVSVKDIDNYKVSSSSIILKIINAVGITYGQRSLDEVNLRLIQHMRGNVILSDTNVARLRELVTNTLGQQKTQYDKGEIKSQIDVVFTELNQALRVERAARDLHTRSHLLNKGWQKRINKIIASRQRLISTPLRHKTTWQQIADYDESSQEIFLAIDATLHTGGWPSLFSKRANSKRLAKFMHGKKILGDKSLKKVKHAIQQTLRDKPSPTNKPKQMTIKKLKLLLAKLNLALRVERTLLEMQQDIDGFSQLQQQHIRNAIAIRDKHLLPNRFRTSWDEVGTFTTSSVTVIEELLATLKVSITEVSRHSSFSHVVISEHQRGLKHMRDNIADKVSHAFCRIIAITALPTETAVKLRAKALALLQIARVERAAREIFRDHELKALLNYQQEEMLQEVQAIKKAALAKRNK